MCWRLSVFVSWFWNWNCNLISCKCGELLDYNINLLWLSLYCVNFKWRSVIDDKECILIWMQNTLSYGGTANAMTQSRVAFKLFGAALYVGDTMKSAWCAKSHDQVISTAHQKSITSRKKNAIQNCDEFKARRDKTRQDKTGWLPRPLSLLLRFQSVVGFYSICFFLVKYKVLDNVVPSTWLWI